jgi:hypothetical protein
MVLGLVASVLATAGPASAAVPGLVRIVASSPSNSADPKTVTATCPAGKRLVGTGAEITGGLGEVVIDDLRPNPGLTANTVTAYEADPLAANWRVTAYAICANPLPGLERRTASSASNSVDPKAATATCPSGKRLTGLGGEITGGLGEVVLDDLRPNAGLTASTVTAYEEDPLATSWRVTAYAICATQ